MARQASTRATRLVLNDVELTVTRKAVRNLHLSVHPPTGAVTITAPPDVTLQTVRAFAIRKLAWIRTQQGKFRQQEREPPRGYAERESHYVWGRRYLLKVVEAEATPSVELRPRALVLRVPPDADVERREAVLEAWRRSILKLEAAPLLERWQARLGVTVNRVHVQRMKTKWGSCNAQARSIRLNAELTKKPLACLEYLILHELVHLIEPTHNARFRALMDRLLPSWPERRAELNRLPVRHEDWSY